MVELMNNPLGEENPEEVLARDSDAVPSAFRPEWRKVGAMLSAATPEGDEEHPSPQFYALQAMCAAFAVFSLLRAAQVFATIAGMAEPDALLYVTALLFFAAYISAIPAISSARIALRAGGPLDELGAGTAMISEEEDKELAKTRMQANFQMANQAFFGLSNIACSIVLLPTLAPTIATTDVRIWFGLVGLVQLTLYPVGCLSWASMYTASCLCRNAETQVIKAIRAIDPTGEQWDAKVAQPALALRKKLGLLSDGWSGGLAAFGVHLWLVAAVLFTMGINMPLCAGLDANFFSPMIGTPRGFTTVFMLVLVLAFTSLPLFMVKDVAHTSTYCGLMMDELNNARAKHGPESHLKIQWLESTLKQLVRSPSLLCAVIPIAIAL
eukprot:COSAG02_NODE_7740_length_2867_cov_2.125723_2_plen_382_part_00